MSSKRLRTSSTCTNINAQSNSPIPEERKLKREVISPAYRPVLHPINIGNEVRAKPRAPVISPRTLNTPRRRSIIVNQYSPPTPSPRSSQITPPPAIKQQSLSPQMDISLSTNVRMPFPRPLQSIVDVSSWADSPLFQGPDSSDRNIPTPPIHQAQISAGNRRVQDMAIRSQGVSPNSVCSIRRSSSLPAGFPSPNQAITPTTSSTSTTEPSVNTDVCHALAQELEETLELLAQKRLQLALLNALKNDDESDEDDEIISIVSPPRDKGDDKEGRGGHDVLLEMGFSPPEVKEALKACNEDMDEAIELLLTPRHTPEFTPPRAGYSLKRLSATSLSPSPSTSLNDRTPGKIKPPPQPTECVVCMENDRNALILTCRHLCVCLDCGKKLKECPICTQSISSILEIYSS